MTTDRITPTFAQMLDDVLATPGIISAAYSAFHSYSFGNMIAAVKPEPVSPEWDAATALHALDISAVPFAHHNGNCQGYAQGRTIAVSPVAALPHKTRFHELAHVVLGHTTEAMCADGDTTPRDVREVEAESVAYILCALLGLPGLDEARGYVQSWAHGCAITEKSAQRIYKAADTIYKAGRTVPA